MKKHTLPFYVLCALIFFMPFRVFSAEDMASPEATVSSFYKWFMRHDNDQTYPLREPEIYNFVEAKTVDKLRRQYAKSGAPQDVDYFLKVQDYAVQDWINHIDAHPAVLLGDQAVVVVSLGQRPKDNVVVVLRKTKKQWKITKVMDTLDYD